MLSFHSGLSYLTSDKTDCRFSSRVKVKVKSPHFTSVVRNSHKLTNKLEADGAFILPFIVSVSISKCRSCGFPVFLLLGFLFTKNLGF